MQSSYLAHRMGMTALLSGAIGIVAVGFLIAALFAPTPAPGTMRRETILFRWQDAGVLLQALSMLPFVVGFHRLAKQRGYHSASALLGLGLLAQATLVVTSALIFTHTASDMLYMAPIGLVGLWVLLANNKRQGLIPVRLAWLGRVAGAGLLTIGIGFFIYVVLVAPAVFVRPLSTAEIDAQTLTTPNLVAHICMAVGTLFGRVVYPIWLVLLGRKLLQLS